MINDHKSENKIKIYDIKNDKIDVNRTVSKKTTTQINE